jgi:3D (Asp-Asp-Asp) domain-containing protein
MDHMSNHFKHFVGIGCFSILLQFSAFAQNAISSTPVNSLQEKALRSDTSSSDSSSSPSSSINPSSNKIALVADAKTTVKSEAKTESRTESAIKSPKINPQNPALNFKVTARESKIDARAFAVPDMDSLGEAQSFQATAYALKGRTRTGASVRRGVIAADPHVLPLGSVVQLRAGKYSGVYTVHDTGKRIKGNVIDVWVPDRGEARQFGRRKIQLHVMKMGPQRHIKK